MSLRAEVLTIGDELLSGARVNGNAAWLGAQLGAVDVRVIHGTVIGDDVEGIVAAMNTAALRSDVVIVTGGLGPTSDDRTREAFAALLGVPLSRHAATESRIIAWYAARDRTPTAAVLHQADIPLGTTALVNDVGTAPGLRGQVHGAMVVCLPGVPAEMAAIMDAAVLPGLASRGTGQVAVGELRTVLVPETVVAASINNVEQRATEAGVRVAYLPSLAEVVVRFVAPQGDAAAHALVAQLVDDAAAVLGDVVAVRGSGTLAEEVVRLAREAGATIAVAESLTGGLVAAALTDVPGASQVLRGAVVAYATELKSALLDVDPALLARVGAVHPEVARAMARGVADRLAATYGVATTGVAGPDAQVTQLPGTVHVAVAGPTGIVVRSLSLQGDRSRIRGATVVHALELLRRSLRGIPPSA